MEETIEWSGYKWLTRERWGSFHPYKPWNWYDPSSVKIENGELILDIHYNPKSFHSGEVDEYGDPVFVTSTYGIGLVSCETNFTFGKFEIEAKLPRGIGLWPAFWLYPIETWPPELDLEFYSGRRGTYRNWNPLKPFRVESCAHTKKEINLKKVPVRRPWFFQLFRNPSEHYNKYTILWTPNKISYSVNGRVIRTVRDKNILNHVGSYKMQVLLNTHIDGKLVKEFDLSKYKEPFRIKYFKYSTI